MKSEGKNAENPLFRKTNGLIHQTNVKRRVVKRIVVNFSSERKTKIAGQRRPLAPDPERSQVNEKGAKVACADGAGGAQASRLGHYLGIPYRVGMGRS